MEWTKEPFFSYVWIRQQGGRARASLASFSWPQPQVQDLSFETPIKRAIVLYAQNLGSQIRTGLIPSGGTISWLYLESRCLAMITTMEEAIEMVQAKDTKERMAGVERLQQLLEHSTKSMSATEVTNLVDASMSLLKDNNFRVSQGALQALAFAASLSGEHLKLHFNALLPAIVERLGDGKQPVRDAARRLLLALMEVSSPTIIVERAGSYAWTHKNWRVREEFARTVASAISLFAATELPFQRLVLPSVLHLLEDSNSNVREAAILCFEEMYHQGGPQFREELQRHNLRPSQLKEINARLEKIEPKMRAFEGMTGHFAPSEIKLSSSLPVIGNKRNSPKTKTVRESSLTAGDNDVTEKPVDPIKVYSEKELVREMDKIAGMLTPEQDWSVRIAAMQKVEGLVFGGAPDYGCFPALLKQLVGPLTVQLSDRRSSIVKQACHLLSLLSKELLGDFEACAELLIPVLFKLVVITVLVIAESADTCIKTMLRNCKVARILPRIVDCAKNDRNAVLRARCCDYALLVLEYWADAPEIQRSADLYEDLIKCCVGDAMSEVRSMARTCYRMFAKTWPERSRRLFSSFDAVIQRLINEEEGGIHKRYASPSIRDRGTQPSRNPALVNPNTQSSATSAHPGYGTSAIVAMDRSATLSSVPSLPLTGNLLMSQRKPSEQAPERSLESVLQASKQQVSAIESMLRGLDSLEKGSVSTVSRPVSRDPGNEVGGSYRRTQSSVFPARAGVDPPSARDPPFPASVSGTSQIPVRPSLGANVYKIGMRSGTLSADLPDVASSQGPIPTDVGKASLLGSMNHEALSTLTTSYAAKRFPMTYERSSQRSSLEDSNDIKAPRRVLKLESQMDKSYVDAPSKDTSYKDLQYSSIPNFQRPLLRKHGPGRSSGINRLSFEDNQLPAGEMFNYTDGLMSLNDALTEGLSVSADWSARVAAFNYLRKMLQQGPKGVQDITQSFEKVMKLFFQHLDDPHHKVAQAALSTLADLIPACRKPFEGYLERILPHVFSRLVDPKELIRQLCSSTLEIVSNTYSIDLVLPALLRSLDEQRSPKAKVAVIEFAISSFTKLGMNGETSSGSGLLKLWLAKLAPLANDKNTKLKETAVTAIISVYSYFDSTSVLNFILGLTIEEQSTLRRSLKQYTPRIEVDLMNFLQSKNQRTRSKSLYDQSDLVGTSSEEGYSGTTARKNQLFGRYSSGSIDSDGGRKWSSVQEPMQFSSHVAGQTNSEEPPKHFYQNESSLNLEEAHGYGKSKDSRSSMEVLTEKLATWNDHTIPDSLDGRLDIENSVGTPRLDSHVLTNIDPRVGILDNRFSGEANPDAEILNEKIGNLKIKQELQQESGPSIPALLHQMCDGNDEKSVRKKREALQMLVQVSKMNDASLWSKYFNQILTGVLEVLDDPDSSVRELALAVIVEMLSNQKDTLEDSVETLLEKLLHATKDLVAKVSTEADRCATIVLSQYDPYRCLTVVVPLLVSEDEKTLVTCIGCLTKLVGRLPPEELMAQLPSFLPALFDAFGNQSADVRKTVVFCLVDIYIVLGKAFLPYLGSLSSTQLRLVTIYANRISQARSGASVESNNA